MTAKKAAAAEKKKSTLLKKEKPPGGRLPEVNIGMVGHVDHGKTSLTAALTGKWTDTHSEEIRRGITIRLGYADAMFYRCPQCTDSPYRMAAQCEKCRSTCTPVRTVSFVDAPGHETLMATVLSGAALMDGALLVISASEPCPQPQTREHLTALDIIGITHIVVVQNKIDLVSREEALKNYQQIKEFLKGSVAGHAPIIPVSALQNVNLDSLIEAIETHIPTPQRDPAKPPQMLIARSFDINKPGTPIEKLNGGVVGGSLIQGRLGVGDNVEIKPGVERKGSFEAVETTVTAIQQANMLLTEASPGGLLGISTGLDPALTRSDALAGNLVGLKGKLPPVLADISVNVHLLQRVVGSKEELAVTSIKTGDALMLTVGIARTLGMVTSAAEQRIQAQLRIPICAEKGQRIAISRQVAGRWRLIGWGELL